VLLPSNIPAAAIPLLSVEWDATNAELGWVVGAHLFGYSIAVLFLLPLTDRFGPAPLVLGGAALSAAASLALPLLAHDVTTAVVTRLAAGVGLAGVYMPGVRVIAATTPEGRRGAAVGLFVAAFYLGSAVSFLFAGVLLASAGWREAAVSSAAIAAIGVLVAIPALGGLGAGGSRGVLDPTVLRHRALVRTIAAYSGHAWELFASRAWLSPFLAAILIAGGSVAQEATAEAGRWAGLILAAGIPAVFLGAWLSDHAGRVRTALAMGLASGALGLVFGALGAAPWPVVIAVAFMYSGLIAADSAVYSTRVTELAPPARIGSAQAIQAFSGFALGAAGPVAVGFALDIGLGWIGAFAVAGAASLVACAPLVLDLRESATGDPSATS